MFNRETFALTALKQAISRARVPLREISVGQHLASGDDTRIDVLHPPPDGMGETENADSICLAIIWRGRRILLTGDLAPPGLETVVAERSEPFDVIMVPHHGSAASLPPVFAAWCRAHWAVISGDLTHDSHVAVKAYQDAGSIVLNTATSGAVHFYLPPDGGPIRMDCYRRGERW
jgi:competence protein ComEC